MFTNTAVPPLYVFVAQGTGASETLALLEFLRLNLPNVPPRKLYFWCPGDNVLFDESPTAETPIVISGQDMGDHDVRHLMLGAGFQVGAVRRSRPREGS